MVFKALFALVVAAEFVSVPLFLKYYWPEKCVKSLIYKMISATLFVLCGVFAMQISGNKSEYTVLMIWGLVLGWIGDLFLHALSEKMSLFAIGFVSFLAGHVVYIVAFQKEIAKLAPGSAAFEWYEILFVVLFVGILMSYFLIKKLMRDRVYMLVAFAVYGVILAAMLAKAARYAIGIYNMGANENIVMVFVTLVVGALLFTVSDVLLAFIIGANMLSRPMRIANIATYFAAQILLASSILVVPVL